MQNSIIYKYNKYIQVSGTLFYAFDYLLGLCEKDFYNPDGKGFDRKNKTIWYIVISSKFKKNYLLKLKHLFRTKYPLWIKNFGRDKNLFELTKLLLTDEERELLKFQQLILNEAFSRIKLIIPTQLLKMELNKVLFPNYDSWLELNNFIKAKEFLVFQNRQIKSLDKDELPISNISNINTTFYSELSSQVPNQLAPNQKIVMYSLKLNLKYNIPKKLFKVFPKTENISVSKPIVNSTNFYIINQKPSLFVHLPKGNSIAISGLPEPTFFLNTKRIDYYQNFSRFDENNRILIEARYLNIPIRVIKTETKELKSISNLSNSIEDIENLEEDSSVGRLKNDLQNYNLDENDIIIDQL